MTKSNFGPNFDTSDQPSPYMYA